MEKIRMISRIGNRRAFTLVEMLVVLAIMAMIMAISLPFTAGFGKGLKIKTTAKAIVGMMSVARSNAVTYRQSRRIQDNLCDRDYWKNYYKLSYNKKHLH
jgi:prepilin-type N-terminal cleavage/methylation domain-containing protein